MWSLRQTAKLQWPLALQVKSRVTSKLTVSWWQAKFLAIFMQQTELDGAPNSWTEIAPLDVLGDWARYALRPHTGLRHQLRVHMAALGLPIAGDGIYPALTPEAAPDYARPLQLLARAIAFTDPISGQAQRFESLQTLKTLAEIQANYTAQVFADGPA